MFTTIPYTYSEDDPTDPKKKRKITKTGTLLNWNDSEVARFTGDGQEDQVEVWKTHYGYLGWWIAAWNRGERPDWDDRR